MAKITREIGYTCSDGKNFRALDTAHEHQVHIDLSKLFGKADSISLTVLSQKWRAVNKITELDLQ